MWMAIEMPATRRAVMTALTTPTVRAVIVHGSHRVLSVSVIYRSSCCQRNDISFVVIKWNGGIKTFCSC